MIAFQILVTKLFVLLCACARLEPPADMDCKKLQPVSDSTVIQSLKSPFSSL